MSIILDTCVWSHFLRRDRAGGEAVSGEVARLIRADAVVMMGPIRQELLSGVQSSRYKQLKEYLRFFPNLPLQEEDDETAAGQYNLLRENGIQGGSTDLLICAAAIRRGLRIFTIDRDFEFYEKHLPIALHKVR